MSEFIYKCIIKPSLDSNKKYKERAKSLSLGCSSYLIYNQSAYIINHLCIVNFVLITSVFQILGLPCPQLGDLSDLVQINDPTRLGLRYSDLLRIDTIHVDIVPEKKGIFLKHIEYQVISKVCVGFLVSKLLLLMMIF